MTRPLCCVAALLLLGAASLAQPQEGSPNIRRHGHGWRVTFPPGSPTDDELARLRPKLDQLKPWVYLELNGSRVTDAGLAGLKGLKHITGLWLYGARVTEAGLAHLAAFPDLEGLGLPDTVTDAGLALVGKLTNLRSLSAAGPKMTPAGLKHLRGLTKLERLDSSTMLRRITDEGMGHLVNLTRLKTLEIDGTKLTSAGLAALQAMPDLNSLSIRAGEVTNDGLKHLAGLKRLQQLTLARLGHVTDEGFVHLKGLKNLEVLTLAYNGENVTDACLVHLKDLPRLHWLRYDGPGSNGLGALPTLKGLRHLELRLAGARDHDLRHVGQLAQLEELSLDLTESKVTEAALKHLAGLSKLRRLGLYTSTYFAPESIAALTKAIPGLDVHRRRP